MQNIGLLGWMWMLLLAHPADVYAEASQKADVFVIVGYEKEGPVDPALKSIPALSKPPFSAFRSLKLLAKPTVELQQHQPSHVDLPNGRRLELVWDKTETNARVRIRVSINKPNQKDYLPLLEVVASKGEPFFVAGQKHEGGTLIIGVRVQP